MEASEQHAANKDSAQENSLNNTVLTSERPPSINEHGDWPNQNKSGWLDQYLIEHSTIVLPKA